ncbi:MAG: LuxR C-terminal-related transcriptional regulator [Microbacterium sp.]|uniref:LuxR C-terminal-related transcriptional regulator n=1 Tax=Microbacterium sp. TaxID=51671 RepID=UPI0039E699E9
MLDITPAGGRSRPALPAVEAGGREPDRIASAAIAGIVDRPRLYQILDAPLVRICVVQGPSGSGKTTLLRGWIAQKGPEPRVLWTSISAGVRGRQTFWQHVAASAVRLGGLSDDETARMRAQLGAAVDPVHIATALLADAGPVVLAFDAYEHLDDAMGEVDQDLARLVDALPDLRIMLTTRSATALADHDVSGGVVRVVTLADLALTSDEVGALISAQTGMEDPRLARNVARATRGFPLTVRAVVLALSQLGRIPHVDSMEWDAVVAAKLESLLPDRVAVQFVSDTSVPPYLDRELAAALSDCPNVDELFDTLERSGFGRWIPYARKHPVFQYVETVRDTFRARASDDPERFRRLSAIAAGWLFDHDDVDQALLYAIEGGDYALADRVFVQLMITNPDSYTTDRFLSALRTVPESELVHFPMLAFGLGLALGSNPLLRGEAPRAYRLAVAATTHPTYIHPAVDGFSLDAMQAVALRLLGRFRDSAEACRRVVGELDDTPPELLRAFGDHYGTILRQVSFSLLQGGLIDEALAAMTRSVALCENQTTRNYSVVYAAGASAFSGDVARGSALLSSIDTHAWPDEFRGSYMNGMGVVAEGYALLDAMDFAGAVELLRSTESYMQTAEFWPFLTAISVAARVGLGHGRAEAQRVTRALAAPLPPPGVADNVATEHLRAAVALAWMAGGDHRAAEDILDGQPEDSPYLAAARVACLMASGREDDALKRARTLLELPTHTLRTRAETQTAAAAAALRRDERELAREWLDDAAIVWETYGPRAHVAMLPPGERRRLLEFSRGRKSVALRRYLDVPVVEALPVGPAASLTPREQVVLNALAAHGSVREIAQALVVSPHTVKAQLQSVYRKLGVSSRRAALAVGSELGLIAPDSTKKY